MSQVSDEILKSGCNCAGAATGLNTERDIYGEVSLPDADVIMYQPFDVNLRLWNDSTQAVGPLSLVIRPGEYISTCSESCAVA